MSRKLPVQCLTLLSLLGMTVIARNSAAAENSPSESSPDTAGLQEVVVTAGKRAETELNVPTTISVLSSASLEHQGIDNFADFSKVASGISTIDATSPGHGAIVIRGITTGVLQNAPTTGLYLDEIPFTTTSPIAGAGGTTFDPNLTDVERIEVLKGPQSTLYGASAMGGIVKVVTAKPSLTELSGNVKVQGGSTDGGGASWGSRGSVNLPLADGVAALRISAFERHDGGFIDNVLTRQNDINSANTTGGRVSLRLKFSDAIETTLSALYQNVTGGGFGYQYVDQNTLQPLYGEKNISAYFNNEFRTTYKAISDATSVDFGFADFTNSLSYINEKDSVLKDYTTAFGFILRNPPPNSAIHYLASPTTNRVTEEARLASKSGQPFEWLAGIYYTNERDSSLNDLRGLNGLTGVPLPAPNYDFYTPHQYPTFKEVAGFGDLTYHFNDKFELTGGARYSHNTQEFNVYRSGLLGGTQLPPGSSSDSAATYLATGSFHLDPTSTFYVRAASAYNPGSTQVVASSSIPAVYGPSTLWNYEAGYKASLFNGRLNVEASAYHIKWTKIQLNSIINGFTVISNAGDARADGAELNVTAQPLTPLQVGFNTNYNNGQILTKNVAIGALAGDKLPYAPLLVGNLFAELSEPLGQGGLIGRLGFNYSFQGSRYTSFSQDGIDTRYHLPSYSDVGAHIGLDWGHYSFDLRGSNLTNEIGVTSARLIRVVPFQNVPAWATVSRPRSVTASLSAKF